MRLYEVYTPSYGQTQFGLKGVLEKIDYLADLGINTIWMTPIFDGNYNGYAERNYYKVNPALGTEDDLKTNCSESSPERNKNSARLGNKSYLDSPSFFSEYSCSKICHLPFQIIICGQEPLVASAFNYYYNWSDLPNLNVNNMRLQNYLYNVAEYWIREFDIDGYRCDVAWGIEERNSNFWKVMRRQD